MIYDFLALLTGWAVSVIETTGYLGIGFLMLLESAAIAVPSEIIMPFGGFLAAQGKFNFWLVVLAGTIGNLFGCSILYYVGLRGARPFLLKHGKFLFIHPEDIKRVDIWFQRYGEITVLFARLLPIARTFSSLPAGVARMNFPKFIIYTFFGSFGWALLFTFLGFKLGENWQALEVYFRRFDLLIAAVIILSLGLWIVRHFWHNKKTDIL